MGSNTVRNPIDLTRLPLNFYLRCQESGRGRATGTDRRERNKLFVIDYVLPSAVKTETLLQG